MARLPIATRESVPEAQRALFDELVQRMGAVPRYGPGSVMIHVPEAHRWATGLNDYLRNQSSLPRKVQELAMLDGPSAGLPAYLECPRSLSPPGRCT
jgi:hypothetical protein